VTGWGRDDEELDRSVGAIQDLMGLTGGDGEALAGQESVFDTGRFNG
jgi:hypothetical protein